MDEVFPPLFDLMFYSIPLHSVKGGFDRGENEVFLEIEIDDEKKEGPLPFYT